MSEPNPLPPPPYNDGSSSGDSDLPAAPRRLRVVAGIATVAIAVAAAGGFLALRAFHGSADTVVSMVPGDTALYVTVNLDPPAGQKLAVAGLFNKFPALTDQKRNATVNAWLDTAFSSTGLKHDDITSWVGSEVSIAMPPSAISSVALGGGGATSTQHDVSVLVASRDDAKAQVALDKFRNGPTGRASRWTTSVFDGVTVTAGAGPGAGAYAITNHTVILASTRTAVDAVIDTTQGRRASLQSSSRYRAVESQLPADRLGLIYMDIPAFVNGVASSLPSIPGAQTQLSAARAYGGVGAALVASTDGVAVYGTVDFDASKLTAAQRTQLGAAPHANGSLAFVPKTAFGFLALTGLQQTLTSVLQTVSPTGSAIDATLQQLGLTGSAGIIGHLSGDAAIEVNQAPGHTTPAGALVFATNSTSAAQSFLDHLMSSVCGQASLCDPSQITTQLDAGVTISSVPLAATPGTGIAPSWAVSNGWAIIATSPAEVRAMLAGHASGSNISTSPGYTAVTSHVGTSNNGMFYVDVPSVLTAIRTVLPAGAQASFDKSVAPSLGHLGAVAFSSKNASDHMTFTVFVQVR
jgi:uncharacterized lipoprotein YbaY